MSSSPTPTESSGTSEPSKRPSPSSSTDSSAADSSDAPLPPAPVASTARHGTPKRKDPRKSAENKARWAAGERWVIPTAPGSIPKPPSKLLRKPPRPDIPPPPEYAPSSVHDITYYGRTSGLKSPLAGFIEFARDCLKIVDKKGHRVPFKLNSTQHRIIVILEGLILRGIPPRLVVLKSRQVGVSTLVEALLFWACLTRPDWSTLVIAHNMKSSRVLFRMSRNFHRTLPAEMVQKKKIDNVHEIEFDSGSRMQIEVQGDPRGYVAQGVHLSEYAFYEQPESTLVAVMQALPNVLGSLAVIESTANGVGNKFHKLWQRATGLALDADVPLDERGWTPVFVPWFDHEEYKIIKGSAELDPTSEELRLMREYNVTKAQLKWRRWCISANLDGDEEKFGQEYPACVVVGTRVGTARGIVPVEEVVEGDETAHGRVAHLYRQTASPIWTLRTQLGYEFSGTWDHPVFTPAGATIRLSELQPGQTVSLQPPKLSEQEHAILWADHGVQCSVAVTPEWCRFLGLFAGDGSISGDTLSLAGDLQDADVTAEGVRLIEALFGVRPATRIVGDKRGGVEVRVGSKAIRRVLERLGVVQMRKSGSPTRTVCVPEAVWRSPRGHVREFLRALFEADGFVGAQGRVSLFSKSRGFLRDVQLLLLGFGITSRLHSATKRAGDGHTYAGNQLSLRKEEARIFHTSIGFLSARKTARCKTPPTRWSRALPVAMSDAVASVSVGSAAETYDLTVSGGHAFDAGGILTHNTDQEAFMLSGRPAFDVRAVEHYTKVVADAVRLGTLPKRCEIESDPPGVGDPAIVEYDRGRLRIFSPPIDRHTYIVGADPSEGDPGSDHSPLAVLDQQTLDFAATWYGKAPPDVLACHAIDLAKYYRNALIINEANNHGILFHETVIQLGYPYLYYRKVSEDSVAGEVTEKPGYLSTRRNREHLFNTLRKYVRMRMGKIPCPHLVAQMQSLVYIEGKADAQSGAEKDLLIAAALCLMAHRGSMDAPLEPLPDEVVRSAASDVLMMADRDPERAAKIAFDRLGLTMDECLRLDAAILAREQRQKRAGLGGMR